jgi:hypothetical protein
VIAAGQHHGRAVERLAARPHTELDEVGQLAPVGRRAVIGTVDDAVGRRRADDAVGDRERLGPLDDRHGAFAERRSLAVVGQDGALAADHHDERERRPVLEAHRPRRRHHALPEEGAVGVDALQKAGERVHRPSLDAQTSHRAPQPWKLSPTAGSLGAMTTATREIRLAARPSGEPGPADFKLAQTTMPTPGPGQVVVRNTWMSVDPYMRGRMDDSPSYLPPFEIGRPLEGSALGEVIASRSDDVPLGATVVHFAGWRDHSLLDAADATVVDPRLARRRRGSGRWARRAWRPGSHSRRSRRCARVTSSSSPPPLERSAAWPGRSRASSAPRA